MRGAHYDTGEASELEPSGRTIRITTEQVCRIYRVPPWLVDHRVAVPPRLSLRRLKWWWICR